MPNRDRRGLDAHERRGFVTLALIGVQLVVLAERSRSHATTSCTASIFKQLIVLSARG
jgi:hypothetical protein